MGLIDQRYKNTAADVAKYIIHFAHEAEELITNLKLQKLLYYAQGYYLAFEGEVLFEDEIQAWIHGPAVPGVYGQYKHNRWNPIGEDVDSPHFTEPVQEVLDKVIVTFLPIDAYKLEQMTHREPPWLVARGDLPPDAVCKNPIQTKTMQAYFKYLLESEQA